MSRLITHLRVNNPTKHRRKDVFSCIVPLDKEVSLPRVLDHGAATLASVAPFGGKYQDGSPKFARISMLDTLEPLESKTITLKETDKVVKWPFTYSPRILNSLLDSKLELSFDGTIVPFKRLRLQHSDHLTQVFRMSSRKPDSIFWADICFELGTGLDHIKFSLVVGVSDITSKTLQDTIQANLKLRCKGCIPSIRFPEKKGVISQWNQIEGLWEVILSAPVMMADGQSLCFEGVLLFTDVKEDNYLDPDDLRASTLLAESELPVQSVCLDWADKWGPWSYIPDTPGFAGQEAKIKEAQRLAAQDYNRIPKLDPWSAPIHGCAPRPANTGSQSDFGIAQLYECLESGEPSHLYPILHSVTQEFCRPGLFMTPGVDFIRAVDHPQCRMWTGRPHFDTSISPDQLGKERPYSLSTARSQRGESWHNHDREHESYNWLAGFALATGHRRAVWLCEARTETWLLSQPHSGGLTIQPLGNSRAIGRALAAGVWLYLVTGNEELKQRLDSRVSLTLKNDWHGSQPGRLPVLNVLNPDPRTLPVRYWSAWMEAIGVYGISAVHELTGNQDALDIARKVARTVAIHGFHLVDGRWSVGYAIAENGEQFLTEDQKNDPSLSKWSPGLALWAMPCILLGKRWAEEAEDSEWQNRCTEILTQHLGGREKWDKMTPWIGIP